MYKTHILRATQQREVKELHKRIKRINIAKMSIIRK